MKKIRRRQLPSGWYPASERETLKEIEGFKKIYQNSLLSQKYSIGGIVPHAGWYFSGEVAAVVMELLSRRQPEVVIIYGGHLPEGDQPLITLAESMETPLGDLENDTGLAAEIFEKFDFAEDVFPDNTVEIQLPLVKYFFPGAKVLCLRLPASLESLRLAPLILEKVKKYYSKYIFLASTDLTHYGPNYDFSPKGTGKKALDWVKEVNDKGFIDLAVALKAKELIEYANRSGSACSAGAAAGLIVTAKQLGAVSGKLLKYKTSYEVMPDAEGSFVGYAGIVY